MRFFTLILLFLLCAPQTTPRAFAQAPINQADGPAGSPLRSKDSQSSKGAKGVKPTSPVFSEFSQRYWSRLQYGWTQSDLEAIQNLGTQAHLVQTLNTASSELKGLQSGAVRQEAQALALAALTARLEGRRSTAEEADQVQKKLAKARREAITQSVDRSLEFYQTTRSPASAKLLWFWTNHFSVYAKKGAVAFWLHDYERNAIAPHALTSLQSLLTHAVLHPAMLLYLDNQNNKAGKINENLAREILELHTQGVGSGYTQADVENLAKALTGVVPALMDENNQPVQCKKRCTLLDKTGSMVDLKNHDQSPKLILGKTYRQTDGTEILQILEDLAQNSKMHRFVTSKLLTYFLGGTPSDADIEAVAQNFTGKRNDNLMQASLKVMQLLASQSTTSQAARAMRNEFKDPFSFYLGVARTLAQAGIKIPNKDLHKALEEESMALFGRVTPDGYPLDAAMWDTPKSLNSRKTFLTKTIQAALKQTQKQTRQTSVESLITALEYRLGSKTRLILEPARNNPGNWLVAYFLSPEFLLH